MGLEPFHVPFHSVLFQHLDVEENIGPQMREQKHMAVHNAKEVAQRVLKYSWKNLWAGEKERILGSL